MPLQKWSDNILVADLQDEPQFSEDLNALFDMLEADDRFDVVLNFADVSYINSSNIAKLLKLRKMILTRQRRVLLCGINSHVWGVFLVTGLDKIFQFADDLATGLAGLQMAGGNP